MSFSTTKAVTVIAGLLALAVLLCALFLPVSPTRTRSAPELVAVIRTAILTGDQARGEAAYDRLKDLGLAAIPFAGGLLHDPDSKVRAGGAELVKELIERIRERNEDGYTPVELRETIPLLVSALQTGDEDVRSEVASALGKIGRDAAVAIPPLEQALNDPSKKVREKAARALRRIQGQFAP